MNEWTIGQIVVLMND